MRVRVTTGKTAPGLEAGDPVRLRATLQPPAGPALPGGYDFARQAWFERLGAVGYTWSAPQPRRHAGAPPWGLRLWAAIERLRQAIGRRITAVLPGRDRRHRQRADHGRARRHPGGDHRRVPRFRASAHLSISGLHMAIMAGSVFYLVRLVLAAFPAHRVALSDQEVGGGRGACSAPSPIC